MRKLFIVAILGISTFASGAYAAGFLDNVTDFVQGKNQFHSISSDELTVQNWKPFLDTPKENVFYREKDVTNGCVDGIWLKHILKDGGQTSYKHYQTNCSGTNDIVRNAKVTQLADGTFERKKQDKVVKEAAEADKIRGLICKPPKQKSPQKPVAAPPKKTSDIGIDILPPEYKKRGACAYFRADTDELISSDVLDGNGQAVVKNGEGYHYFSFNGQVIKLHDSTSISGWVSTTTYKHAGYVLSLIGPDNTSVSNGVIRSTYRLKVKGHGINKTVPVSCICAQ